MYCLRKKSFFYYFFINIILFGHLRLSLKKQHIQFSLKVLNSITVNDTTQYTFRYIIIPKTAKLLENHFRQKCEILLSKHHMATVEEIPHLHLSGTV